MKLLRAFSLSLVFLAGLRCLAADPVLLSGGDSLVRCVGRFNHEDANGPLCSWSASSVAVTFTGPALDVEISDRGLNFWQIVLDGASAGVLKLEPGRKLYPVVSGLPEGRHTVELVKRTEAHVGVSQIVSFRLPEGGAFAETPARPRRIEVIGDSISCGYGNEAPNKETHFSPDTENGWLAYGAVAARAVNADYVCIAWSGKKLWPDNTIVALYDDVLPGKPGPKWDFSAWTPDVVVVNLGTNDFAKQNPDEAGWTAAYVDFIKRIRSNYPKAPVYCAVGTMMSDWPQTRTPRTVILGYLAKVIEQANAAGGPPVRLLDFGVQRQEDGIGADWHPSVNTNAKMAEKLVAALKTDLGW